MRKIIFLDYLLALMLGCSQQLIAAENEPLLKPFVLAHEFKEGSIDAIAKVTGAKLTGTGFEIIGQYAPYPSAHILIVTHPLLKTIAAKTEYGGFGAVIRVGIAATDKGIQLSYNNPNYIGVAYNLKNDLAVIRTKLAQSLGSISEYGGEGITRDDLASYNYAMGLEDFFGFYDLHEHRSHEEALARIEARLRTNESGIVKVYRLDIPGKQQTVFGIGMMGDVNKESFLNDAHVMTIVDHQALKRPAHLPYEIMVNGKKVIAMHPHYRIAVNFPDLRMFGEHGFGKMINLPYVYDEHFTKLAGGKWPRPDQYSYQ